MSSCWSLALRSSFVFVLTWMCLAVSVQGESPTARELDFFERQIRPMLVQHCYECHGKEAVEGGLRLDRYEQLLQGGDIVSAANKRKTDQVNLLAGAPNRVVYVSRQHGRDRQLDPGQVDSLPTADCSAGDDATIGSIVGYPLDLQSDGSVSQQHTVTSL